MASDRLFNFARWLRRLVASDMSTAAREQRRLELWMIARTHGDAQIVSLYTERCGADIRPRDAPLGRMIKAILDAEFPKAKANA